MQRSAIVIGCRLSVCLSVVCRLWHACIVAKRFKFSAIFNIHLKFHGDRPRGTPPPGELNTRGAKYSDLGPIDGYISKTVQDRR